MPLHPPRHLYRFQWPQESLMVPDDVVDNAVLDPLFGTHYVVAVCVALDPLVILPCVGGEDLVQAALGHDELFGVDLHVRGLTGEPADARLVQEYARIRQGVPLVLGTGGEQEGPHRRRHAEGRSRDVGLDELHGVVDRKTGRDAAARGVDVEVDVLFGVLALEVQELRHYGVGHLIIHGCPEEDDAVLEKPRVDVHGPLPTRALLYNVGDNVVYAVAHSCSSRSSLSVTPALASTGSSSSAGSSASSSSSSGKGTGTAFSTRKSRALWREISSSSNAYVPLLRRVWAISSALLSEFSARWPISCITSSSSATMASAVATASSTSSFLMVSLASGMTRSSNPAWSVPASL